MTDQELAKKAYHAWDMCGGRSLGGWYAPYTEDAWVQVVETIREELARGSKS